ncbi:MAG: hypothetical protein PF545_02210, partial [Elusimicrobia bacterium]|nr:hypothetical protein [Elusimicrobiota bacterium]
TNPVYAGGETFYYVSDRWGRNEIYFYDGKKSVNILKNYFGSDVKMLFTGRKQDRAIAYSEDSGDLVFLAKDKNDIFLGIYSSFSDKSFSNKVKEIDLGEIKEARSVSISRDGSKILLTGLNNGSRNIYIYDRNKDGFQQIKGSGDIDYTPIFYPSGDRILTVTERNYNTDLRAIDLNTSESTWLTETPANEIFPAFDRKSAGKPETIFYSSDKNSVYNLFSMKLSSMNFSSRNLSSIKTTGGETKALTNIKTGVFYPSPGGDGKVPDEKVPDKIIGSVYHKGSFKIGEFKTDGPGFKVDSKIKYIKDLSTVTLSAVSVKSKDYKFSFSTDFFLPSFLYSTDIGFVGGGYYMASDMLGRHNLDIYGWGWPGLHNARINYTLKKWRPDIYIGAYSQGEKYYLRDEYNERYLVSEYDYYVNTGFSYPLDSFNALSLWGTALSENIDDETIEHIAHKTETGVGIGYTRNTTVIEPFMPLKGNTLQLLVYSARPWEKFSKKYNLYSASARRYTSLSKKLNWSNRIYYGRSEGPDRKKFKLDSGYSSAGYPYRLRGYKRGFFRDNNLISLSSELRYMLLPELKWHIYFMWPDINIDSLSLKVFTDAGTCWNDGNDPDNIDLWGKSWGLGFKINIYIMQMAPAFLDVEFARPYDKDSWKFYLHLSAGYIKW